MDDMRADMNLSGISSMATKRVLREIVEEYRIRTGRIVSIESVGGVEAARRVEDGELFDFIVLSEDALDKLAERGHVDLASKVGVARSGIAVAVANGGLTPDILTESALRSAVEKAGSIGYSTGPSGVYLRTLLNNWGVQDTGTQLIQASPGVPVAHLLATGQVDLGFQQVSELVGQPGISIIGELPASIQLYTTFAAAATTPMRSAQPVLDFLAYMRADVTSAIKQRHGMTPVLSPIGA